MLRFPVQEVKPEAVRVNRVSDPLMFREVLASPPYSVRREKALCVS